MDLVALAERAVERALKAGADEADAFATASTLFVVEVERGSVKLARRLADGGVGVRAVARGSVGFAYANQLALRAVGAAAADAAALARAGTPDPDFRGLPSSPGPRAVPGLEDRRVAAADPATVVAEVAAAARAVAAGRAIYSVNLTYVLGHQRRALATSGGFQGADALTAVDCSAEVVARADGASFSSYEWGASRRLGDVDVQAVASTAADHARRGLRGRRMETATLPVVLDPVATALLLGGGLAPALSAEAVQRKRSYLTGRRGQAIASPLLSVVDDATLPGGLGSYGFDGEGVPGQRKVLVRKGVLRSFLYDGYTAGREGRRSTGNALREGTGPHLWSYRSLPAIGPSNLVIAGGRGSVEDLVGQVRRGVYLRLTFDRPNLATGEFSGLIGEGFLVERGEIRESLRETALGIGMLELLRGTVAVSAERRELFGIVAPGLLVRRARIAGSRG